MKKKKYIKIVIILFKKYKITLLNCCISFQMLTLNCHTHLTVD